MDLNSKSFNCSILNLGARYFVLLERMFDARCGARYERAPNFFQVLKLYKEESLF